MSARAAILGVGVAAAGLFYMARGAGLLEGGEHAGSGAEGGELEVEGVGIFRGLFNMAKNAALNPSAMSAAGLDLLKQFEGFSATPYDDFKGQSIGYGHLIKAGESYAFVTREQAEALLRDDVAWAERAVSAAVSVPLTQAQFDALASLAYNIGEGAFKRSTLVRLLNEGDYMGAAEQFARWNRAGGAVHPGLVKRRALERSVFAGGPYNIGSAYA